MRDRTRVRRILPKKRSNASQRKTAQTNNDNNRKREKVVGYSLSSESGLRMNKSVVDRFSIKRISMMLK